MGKKIKYLYKIIKQQIIFLMYPYNRLGAPGYPYNVNNALLNSQAVASENMALSNANNNLQNQVQNLGATNNNLTNENANLQQVVTAEQAEINQLRMENTNLVAQCQNLATTNAAL